jgi:hypothetical protein
VQKIDMHQRIDQRSTLLLDSYSDGTTCKPIPQQLNPALQGLRSLIQREALPLVTVSFMQGAGVCLVRPIQSDKCSDFDIRFRHLQTSPSFPWFKTRPAGSAHNPYSRVLEGHHLSIRSTSRADRARKSPPTVETVGWLIRNATQPAFHKGNSSQQEKEKRTKKEKEKRPVENAVAMEIRKRIGGLRQHFLIRIPTATLEKPRYASAFPHFPQGPATIHSYEENFHLKNYKGWLRHEPKSRVASLAGADGVVLVNHRLFVDQHHPVRSIS